MTLTSGTVIDRITRVGDVGEPGYSAYGQILPKCTYSGSKDDWHGATQDALSSLLPTCYITESVYSYLTKAEIESVKSRIQGIVPDLYAERVYGGIDHTFMKSYYCWQFLDGIESRPLSMPCEPGEIDDGIVDEPDAGEPGDDISPDGDITPGDEYPPKSELATDLSSIFGDLDTKWIIIAVIGIALLGLLS